VPTDFMLEWMPKLCQQMLEYMILATIGIQCLESGINSAVHSRFSKTGGELAEMKSHLINQVEYDPVL
jgi:hypothetical protein